MKIPFTCQECGTEGITHISQPRKFCSNECRLTVLHRETPEKKKTGEYRKCLTCGDDIYVKLRLIDVPTKGKYCSCECYYKDKGCDDPKVEKIYSSAKWRTIRKLILERDNHECQACGEIERLEVHHIVSSIEEDFRYDLDNLITLCHDCHNKAHWRFC